MRDNILNTEDTESAECAVRISKGNSLRRGDVGSYVTQHKSSG
jgi:hypothetical protein